MDAAIKTALDKDRLVDITTTGRKTGRHHRKEVAFDYVDGKVYLSGRPGPRSWYANLLANPDFTFHFKQSLQRDVSARATPITEKAQRRRVFGRFKAEEQRMNTMDVEAWTAGSPLVEVEIRKG